MLKHSKSSHYPLPSCFSKGWWCETEKGPATWQHGIKHRSHDEQATELQFPAVATCCHRRHLHWILPREVHLVDNKRRFTTVCPPPAPPPLTPFLQCFPNLKGGYKKETRRNDKMPRVFSFNPKSSVVTWPPVVHTHLCTKSSNGPLSPPPRYTVIKQKCIYTHMLKNTHTHTRTHTGTQANKHIHVFSQMSGMKFILFFLFCCNLQFVLWWGIGFFKGWVGWVKKGENLPSVTASVAG